MNKWRKFSSADDLDRALAGHIAIRLSQDIDHRGSASLAVSGGSTPRNMFRLLGQSRLDWSRVWITLVDERWVDTRSPDSNERLVRENLLQGEARGANFVGLTGDQADAREALAEVSRRLEALPRPLSMVVLGMGGDGHTASWFPQASNLEQLLDEHGSTIVAASDPVTAPHQRITLTLPAVLDSADIAVHIVGDGKRAVLERAGRERYPIATILQQTHTPPTIWWAPR